MTILIKELSGEEFQVTVNAKNSTSHNVILTDDIHENLTNGKASKKELIELSVISSYFPEYIKDVKEWGTKN